MTRPHRNTLLELVALIALSAVLGVCAVIASLLIADLVQGRGFNTPALTRPESLVFYLAFAVGLAVASVIWYSRRGDLRPYRYWDGVLWGVVCYALTATIAIVPELPSIARDPVLGLFGTLFFVYIAGGAFALPAILTVAPLALWCWHKLLSALRSS